MRGAQGSSLEDIAVFAALDAFAGISGVSGSGGAHSNLTVVGAQFGIDARDTQPSASLSNIRLHNQSCAAMIHQGLESLTVAGAFITVGPASPAGATAVISGGPNQMPPPSKGLMMNMCPQPILVPATSVAMPSSFSQLIAGPLALVDVAIECVGCHATQSLHSQKMQRTAFASTRNIYLRRVTVVGFDNVVQVFNAANQTSAARYTLITEGSSQAMQVHELSVPVPNQNQKSNSFIDGKLIQAGAGGAVIANVTKLLWPSQRSNFDDLCDKHGWGDNSKFPGHGTMDRVVLNVKQAPYNAVGDGVHDDTASIQHAVSNAAANGHGIVFVPRGAFRISASLIVPAGVQVVGLARHLTTLVSDDASFTPQAPQGGDIHKDPYSNNDPAYDSPPILEFVAVGSRSGQVAADSSNATYTDRSQFASVHAATTVLTSTTSKLETVFFGMTLVLPVNNAKVNVSAWVFKSGVQQPGNFNVARTVRVF
jgi:hypothetical protein